MKKILVLAANPKDTDKLRLDEEVREIRAALRRSRRRDQFEIITELAVRVDDLLPTLSECEPEIVHFSGHSMGSQGLALENVAGTGQLVSTAALARLFKAFNHKTECVFLKGIPEPSTPMFKARVGAVKDADAKTARVGSVHTFCVSGSVSLPDCLDC